MKYVVALALALATVPLHAARAFDGNDDRIVYTHIAAFDGRSTLTVSFWYRPFADGINAFDGGIVEQYDASGDHGWHIAKADANPLAIHAGWRDGDPAHSILFSGSVFTQDVWQHVYVLFDATLAAGDSVNDNRVQTWKNGVHQNPPGSYGAATMPATFGTSTDAFRIGNRWIYDTYFTGEIAEIGIWLDNDTSRVSGLAAGAAPSNYQTNLYVYIPLISGDGAVDVKGNAGSPTITGTTEVSHPPGITYPGGGGGGTKHNMWFGWGIGLVFIGHRLRKNTV